MYGTLPTFQAGVLEDTTERAWRYIEAHLSGDGDCAGLNGMLKLPMTATRANVDPTVSLHEPNEIPDFQEWI
jgi:hypothetical protein